MTGEVNSFRSSFFGGFNRGDVVDYIAKLAQERNELEDAKNKMEEEKRALILEIETLRRETEDTRRSLAEDSERLAGTFESVGDAFSEYEGAFNELCSQFGMVVERLNTELKNADEITAKAPSMLSRAAERFGDLRSEFEAGRNR